MQSKRFGNQCVTDGAGQYFDVVPVESVVDISGYPLPLAPAL